MIVRNFEYLIALNREGHYGRAAQSCNVSQPTLSAGIKQLEKDLDTQIVHHGKRYDGLTKEGTLVLAWAQQMHEDCKGLRRELSALHRGIEGPFRLGVLPGMSAVAPILSVALAEKIPLLEQSITTADSITLSTCLREGALDIAFAYLEDFVDENFDTHLLYRERIFAFQSSIEPQPRNVTWNHVAQLPLCLLDSAIPRSAQTQLAQCARAICTDSLEVLVAHVTSGKYATVLPQSLAARLRQIPHLQALAVSGAGAQASVGFVATRRGLESTTSNALLEMVHTEEVAAPIQALLAAHRSLRPKLSDPANSDK
ncbi:LysR family transcriptional regulator [Burkholderia sp. MSh2]|uniref:DNA-binding transcriptional regulator CynR n=1 Tax=Burkholderia paludis TaxID=1506587 RepID=A0A6J5DSR8_9BURK|nr:MULTISPECIES: LysR family transcriptional regulator [Burkholderia]KEZ07330.1 LysR family transcriptional regulator [Burkholderia sp. MSh2]KFG98477.1 LysR family transcriptional regulator [Burkholderia paludis]CAB3756554.1 hypothetical protein LMG30113_02708 [Burkholderia paludis]VWB62643.1 DNA-binding transcriptional regulator CynR [Burkholderia paludis]